MPPKSLAENELLSKHTTLRVGGPARFFGLAHDLKELGQTLDFARKQGLPYLVIGGGSNILFSDDGFSGVIIKLGGEFEKITVEGQCISAGAAARLTKLAQVAREKGLSGLAFAVGIPGSLGGAVCLNAGAFNRSIGDVVKSVRLFKPEVKVETSFEVDRIRFAYRSCSLPEQGVITGATLELEPGDKAEISAETEEFRQRRRLSQPMGERTAGSVFKNPDGRPAARLIEGAGCKGLKVGRAVVSREHANFIVNEGRAKAQDIYELMMLIRERVWNKFAVTLEPEIKMVGRF